MPSNEDLGPGTRLLIGIIRGESGYQFSPETDWQSLLAACDHHQVAPIVHYRLQTGGYRGVPHDVLEKLGEQFHRIAAYNQFLAGRLLDLTRRFEQEKIPTLALKGPAVARSIYGDLSLRQYEDIDLLVRIEHVSRAVEMMLGRGFRLIQGHLHRYKELDRYHEITLTAPDKSYVIDLHWQLAPPFAQPFAPGVRTLWSRARQLELPQGRIMTLSREDLFLLLCQHGARHRWWQLKWLVDIAVLLRRSDEIEWPQIEKLINLYPMAQRSTSLAAALTREFFGVDVPSRAAKLLAPTARIARVAGNISREFLTCGRTNRSAHDTLLGLEQRPLVRARYMLAEALQYPAREVLFTITGKDLQFVRLPEKLRLFYYLIRPLRLMIQHGRTAARRIWSMAR